MNEETLHQEDNLDTTDIVSDQNTNEENEIVLSDEEYQEVLAKIEKAEKLEKENAKLKKLFSNAREHTKQTQTISNASVKTSNDETQISNTLTKDEVILYAKNFSESDVEYIKKIAILEGITPLQASESPLFVAHKKAQEDKEKSQKAQVGASRRSPSYEAPKDFKTPGLSREEHMKMFNGINR